MYLSAESASDSESGLVSVEARAGASEYGDFMAQYEHLGGISGITVGEEISRTTTRCRQAEGHLGCGGERRRSSHGARWFGRREASAQRIGRGAEQHCFYADEVAADLIDESILPGWPRSDQAAGTTLWLSRNMLVGS
ncbi:hypothetical protein [Micromonospora avicenniae]|uniref:hypothetical protein n=1 Tax=Micromonospora avicenniae TaxID=1198245 RepID=UPI00332BA6ED